MIHITVKQRRLGAIKSKRKLHTTMYYPNLKVEYSECDTTLSNIRAQ